MILLILLLVVLAIIYYVQYFMALYEASTGVNTYFFGTLWDILFWAIPFSMWIAALIDMIKGLRDNLR